jgi:hypothetical protein
MAITLIVEDGSIVANANTYVSLADARTRAELLGVSISATDATADSQLAQAAYYVDNMYSFKGDKVSASQTMQWPRYDVCIDGFSFSSSAIPQQLIDAQIFAAAELESGNVFYPANDGKNIASESVGSIRRSYFDNGKTGTQKTFTSVYAAIKPIISGNGIYHYKVLA